MQSDFHNFLSQYVYEILFSFVNINLLQDLKMNLLISKLNDTETAMAQIETAASEQLQGLALQSEQVLEGAQKKLLLANEKIEEFTVFVKVGVIEGGMFTSAFLQAEALSSFWGFGKLSSSLLLVVADITA